MRLLTYTVPPALAGRSVKSILRGELRFSKARFQSMKWQKGAILLNGRPVRVDAAVRGGDVLTVALAERRAPSTNIAPRALSLDIVFEDEYLLVLNKPTGVPMHSKAAKSMAGALLAYLSGDSAAHFVNRLEKKRNVLQRKFQTNAPNLVWVSDVTCFRLKGKWHYICVIIDLFSRKAVAYGISQKNSTRLITGAFKSAYTRRKPPKGLIFHSDQGAQYMSYSFRELLHERAVTRSFSNAGTPHDNAVAETFFSTLKREELYRTHYRIQL